MRDYFFADASPGARECASKSTEEKGPDHHLQNYYKYKASIIFKFAKPPLAAEPAALHL